MARDIRSETRKRKTEKKKISGRIKQTRPGRLPGQKSIKQKSGSEGTGKAQESKQKKKKWEKEELAREENKGEKQAWVSGKANN